MERTKARPPLTAERVREVRVRIAHGETERAIAKAMGTSRSVVNHIRRGVSFASVK